MVWAVGHDVPINDRIRAFRWHDSFNRGTQIYTYEQPISV